MNESKNDANILRKIAENFLKWFDCKKTGTYSNDQQGAERVIGEGLVTAVNAYKLLKNNEHRGLKMYDPHLNDASPSNALVIIEIIRSGDTDRAEREINFLVKELMGKEKDDFRTVDAFHALAKELYRWADELELETVESEPDDLITLDIAFQEYCVSRPTLQRKITNGEIKSHRPPEAPQNAPHLVKRSDISGRYRPRE